MVNIQVFYSTNVEYFFISLFCTKKHPAFVQSVEGNMLEHHKEILKAINSVALGNRALYVAEESLFADNDIKINRTKSCETSLSTDVIHTSIYFLKSKGYFIEAEKFGYNDNMYIELSDKGLSYGEELAKEIADKKEQIKADTRIAIVCAIAGGIMGLIASIVFWIISEW